MFLIHTFLVIHQTTQMKKQRTNTALLLCTMINDTHPRCVSIYWYGWAEYLSEADRESHKTSCKHALTRIPVKKKSVDAVLDWLQQGTQSSSATYVGAIGEDQFVVKIPGDEVGKFAKLFLEQGASTI